MAEEKETIGSIEYPKGTRQKLEDARRARGRRSIGDLFREDIVGPFLKQLEGGQAAGEKKSRGRK